jgi:hypothetical protein
MDSGRAAVLTVVGLVVVVTAATATPLWTVPEENDLPPLGEGTASVSVVSTPDRATLDAGRQGGDVYYLDVTQTTVQVSQLQGNPILTYSIDIDRLGYSRSSVTSLAESGEGETRLSIARDAIDGANLDRDQYQGRLRLVLRGDGGEETLFTENITVEVRR